MLVVVSFHVLVISAWVATVFLSSHLHSTDAIYVNITFAVVLIICTITDVIQIADALRLSDSATLTTDSGPALTTGGVSGIFTITDHTHRKYDLFDMPVRSGNHSALQKKNKITLLSDTRVKKFL